MKTRTWILIIAAVLAVALGVSLWLVFSAPAADAVEIYSDGKLLYTLLLNEDKKLQISTQTGWNHIEISGGKVGVQSASCPDKLCMHQGFCFGGRDIICLPNRLVIHFVNNGGVDGVSG